MVEHVQAAELDRVFSALADPTRRAILQSLTLRPATINEIAKPFPVSLNAISKHVMVLERAGLLRRGIKGRQHHCRLETSPLRQSDAWMAHYRQFGDERLDALAVYVDKKFKASKAQTQTTTKKGSTHGNVR